MYMTIGDAISRQPPSTHQKQKTIPHHVHSRLLHPTSQKYELLIILFSSTFLTTPIPKSSSTIETR